VGHGAAASFLERQTRLCPIESVNLALLIDAKDDRLVRRTTSEANSPSVPRMQKREIGPRRGVSSAADPAFDPGTRGFNPELVPAEIDTQLNADAVLEEGGIAAHTRRAQPRWKLALAAPRSGRYASKKIDFSVALSTLSN